METTFTFDTAQALELLFFIILFATTLYSSFIVYHWHAYGEKKSTNARATIMYLVGVGACLIGMLVAIGMVV